MLQACTNRSKTTKYYAEKNRFDRNDDSPIAIRNYQDTNLDRTYYCSWCQRSLVKISGRSGENVAYFCNACSTTTNPEETNLRAKSKIEPHEGTNKTPLATTKFPDITVGKKPVEPKGAFAALRARGIRIKNYNEHGQRKGKDEQDEE